MTAKVPTVKVGYQNVEVYIISPDDDKKLEDSEGYYESSQAKLVINKNQCKEEQFATLIHELLHAAFFTYGMKEIIKNPKKEEYIVATLGNAVTQVLRDNPGLMKVIR